MLHWRMGAIYFHIGTVGLIALLIICVMAKKMLELLISICFAFITEITTWLAWVQVETFKDWSFILFNFFTIKTSFFR